MSARLSLVLFVPWQSALALMKRIGCEPARCGIHDLWYECLLCALKAAGGVSKG